jgi:hypothetical protein
VSVLTPSSFDLDDVRYRHLDPVRLAGTTLHEGHVLVDLDAALEEIQRLYCLCLKTERECGRLRTEGARLNGEVERLTERMVRARTHPEVSRVEIGSSADREIRRLEDEVELLRSENRALGEQETPEETRAGIVRWMRKTADQYAAQAELVGPGLANVWRVIATLIAEERDLPSVVGAWQPERCTQAWTQASWPYREVQCDRPEGHDGSHSTTVVGSTRVPHTETRP